MLDTPFFRGVMTEHRFSLIMKFLHFSDNEAFNPNTHPASKLKKIWEVYQALQRNFRQTYIPERDVSVDESLMLYKGALSWIQYIATKRSRFGVKFFMVCESKSGYIWDSVLYTGKDTKWNEKYSNYGLATGHSHPE